MRASVAGWLLLALSAAAAAAQTFAGSTTVVAVEVPLRVLLDGRPVAGLSAEQFRVLDGGEPRRIVHFEVLDLTAATAGAAPAPAAPPAAPAPRNFLFLFDFAYGGVGPTDTRRRMTGSLAALRGLLEDGLAPADRAAVAYLSPLRGLKLVHDFSNDRHRTRRALSALALVIGSRPRQLAAEFADWEVLAPARRGWRARTPRGPLDASLDDLVAEASISSGRGSLDLPHASLLMHLSRALARLGRRVDVAGPRYLVLFSRGPVYGDEATRGRSLMREIVDSFRRESWSVESIDTGGLGFGRGSLVQLSLETGGRLYTNSRDLDLLVEEMAASTEVSYLLTFQADGIPVDGAYRRLEVELIGGPKGAKVVHRPGYYAPSPADLVAPR